MTLEKIKQYMIELTKDNEYPITDVTPTYDKAIVLVRWSNGNGYPIAVKAIRKQSSMTGTALMERKPRDMSVPAFEEAVKEWK